MILGFKPQFVKPILDGSKIHSIRADKNRLWKPGMTIHFATGVRTKNYKQFAKGVCIRVQHITMKMYYKYPVIFISGQQIDRLIIDKLARCDGFIETKDFLNFFPDPFEGTIIHWTDFIYTPSIRFNGLYKYTKYHKKKP